MVRILIIFAEFGGIPDNWKIIHEKYLKKEGCDQEELQVKELMKRGDRNCI